MVKELLKQTREFRENWFQKNWLLIKDLEALKNYLSKTEKIFAFDTETTGLDISTLKLLGLSIWDGKNKPAFVQFNFSFSYDVIFKVGHKKVPKQYSIEKTDAIDLEKALPYLKEFFKGAKLITANGKFDWKVGKKFGFITDSSRIVGDTQLAAYLLGFLPTEQGLKYLAKKLEITGKIEDFDKVSKNNNWHRIDWEKFAEYGAKDVFLTLLLNYKLQEEFQKIDKKFPYQKPKANLKQVYQLVELPLLPVVAEMEYFGVKIDKNFLLSEAKKARELLKQIEDEIFREAGVKFNINSNKQLGEILFKRLKLPIVKKTKSGAAAVDKDVFDELAFKGFEIGIKLKEYSEIKKLITTYLEALPEQVSQDGRLRGNFNQTFTKSGRFSSSSPNLQNIPVGKKYNVRKAFIPEEGFYFVAGDFSQLELRVMAWLSQDKTLVKAYQEGADIHQQTTDNINKRLGLHLTRKEGKMINFAVLFGMGGFSLAEQINKRLKMEYQKGNISKEEFLKRQLSAKQGEQVVQGFFDTYKGYARFVKETVAKTKIRGYSVTQFGRVRFIPEISSKDKKIRAQGERFAISHLIQGTAADLMKIGMWKTSQRLKKEGIDFKPILQVHDEFILEVKKNQAQKALQILKFEMEHIIKSNVPFIFDAGIFANWNDLKEDKQVKIKQEEVKQNKSNLDLWTGLNLI